MPGCPDRVGVGAHFRYLTRGLNSNERRCRKLRDVDQTIKHGPVGRVNSDSLLGGRSGTRDIDPVGAQARAQAVGLSLQRPAQVIRWPGQRELIRK